MEQGGDMCCNLSDGLQIYTLGRFEVVLLGKPLITDNRSSKMWDLFKYLITHRERSISPELLVEALWPDEDYNDAKGALRTLVYRLRKVLSPNPGIPECITSLGGCYKFDITAVARLDAEDFERLGIKGLESKSVHLLQQAASLYLGDYLKDSVFVEWAIPKRTYYRRLYLKIIGELVQALRLEQRHEHAQDICEQALLVEPLDEALNSHYLELLIIQGNHAQAQEHYSTLTARLYRDMGIKPSATLRGIYDRIKSGQREAAATHEVLQLPEGALICKPDVFAGLCSIESHRGLRNDYGVFVVEFSFGTPPDDEVIGLVANSLRKGDAVSRLDGSRIGVLLSHLASAHADMVVHRLSNKINEWACSSGTSMACSYKQI